jgi:hypothetical protein
MVNAEELGVSSKTIDQAMKSEKPDVRRLVGTDGGYGEQMTRNVGVGSKLGIPRGINNLWTNGGVQYAPPIR